MKRRKGLFSVRSEEGRRRIQNGFKINGFLVFFFYDMDFFDEILFLYELFKVIIRDGIRIKGQISVFLFEVRFYKD